jgi:hypothetical protein
MNYKEQIQLTANVRAIFRELAVYKAVAMMAKLNGFVAAVENEGILDVDEMLESVRKSSALQQWVEANFSYVEKSLGLIDESRFLEGLRSALEQWQPSGQPN